MWTSPPCLPSRRKAALFPHRLLLRGAKNGQQRQRRVPPADRGEGIAPLAPLKFDHFRQTRGEGSPNLALSDGTYCYCTLRADMPFADYIPLCAARTGGGETARRHRRGRGGSARQALSSPRCRGFPTHRSSSLADCPFPIAHPATRASTWGKVFGQGAQTLPALSVLLPPRADRRPAHRPLLSGAEKRRLSGAEKPAGLGDGGSVAIYVLLALRGQKKMGSETLRRAKCSRMPREETTGPGPVTVYSCFMRDDVDRQPPHRRSFSTQTV